MADASVIASSLPADALRWSALSRVDYTDAFRVEAGIDRDAGEWARAMLERAPPARRAQLIAGWTCLGLRLECPWAADRLLGWQRRDCGSDTVVLSAWSRLGLHAELLFCAEPGGLLFATLIQQDGPLARLTWRLITPTHQAVVRSLLRGAGHREVIDGSASNR